MKKAQYLLGVFFIVIVDFLWVIGGLLVKQILDNNDHPFLITYWKTGLFSIYLLFYLPFLCNHCRGVQSEEDAKELETTREDAMRGFLIANGNPVQASKKTTCCYCCVVKQSSSKLPLRRTLKLATIFCFIWFGMNYFYNESLFFTSVGSNTVLSSLSGPFCLILSIIFLKEPFSWSNALGVTVVLGGAVLLGTYDESDDNATNPSLGDSLAALSAFLYGCFSTLMKVFLHDESKVSMFLLFGLIGICNLVCMWPFFFVLSWTNTEVMDLPSFDTACLITLAGVISILSDYLWARAILLTSPLIATVGLSMTTPIALLADLLMKDVKRSLLYYMGVTCVVIGFLLVNLKAARSLEMEENLVQRLTINS